MLGAAQNALLSEQPEESMEKVLFVTHTEADGSLSRNSLEALTAAKKLAEGLGVAFSAGLFGEDVKAAADSIGGCGAAAIYGVSGPDFATSRYGSDAAALEAICKEDGGALVVGPADSRLTRVMSGVAQRLGGKVGSHITGLEVKDGKPVITRWYYRQRMFAEIASEARPWMLLVSPGCFEACAAAGAADIKELAVDVPAGAKRTTVKEILTPSADEQTIRPDAETLLVAGAGWTKKQADGAAHADIASTLILGFLDTAKASLGSSKSLVDMGGDGQAVLPFLTHLHQVGQTGATPRHKKGLATCCHGEEPHVVGWRFIGERRAVNLDANCGWARGKADVLYVADAFAVMRKVNELLG